MKVICFGHRQRVGKDTATKFALSHLRTQYPGIKAGRCSMGDQIKDYAYRLYGWGGLMDRVYYENHESEISTILPLLDKTPREIWIEIGNQGRKIHPHTWNHLAVAKFTGDFAVVSDIRSRYDIGFFQQFPTYFVRIDNPRIPKYTDGCDELLEDFQEWNEVIVNDGTFGDFNSRICKLVDKAFLELRGKEL